MHWRRKWQPTPVFFLENPRDGGAWWAAVYGVAQSQTRLKQLSSSSMCLLDSEDYSTGQGQIRLSRLTVGTLEGLLAVPQGYIRWPYMLPS